MSQKRTTVTTCDACGKRVSSTKGTPEGWVIVIVQKANRLSPTREHRRHFCTDHDTRLHIDVELPGDGPIEAFQRGSTEPYTPGS